jgi:hypothetical protein
MGNTTPTIGSEPLKAANYAAIAAAIATAVGGYKLFEPKLERIRAIRNEVGRLDLGFRLFYEWPQYVLIALSITIFVDLVAAFFDTLHAGVITAVGPKGWLAMVLAPETTIWVVVSLPIVGAIIYWNGVPKLLLTLTRLLSALPIPGLQNRFGENGESLGWHQTAAVIEGPDKGQPLMIDDTGIDRVAWAVLARLSKNAGAGAFAAEPDKLAESERANLALFGCILESIHYAQRWPLPKWGQFYASLADIQRTDGLFTPQSLLTYQTGHAYFEVLRDRLNKALKSRHEPAPPDRSLAAAADISRAWELLTARAKGDVLQLAPPLTRFLGGRVAWLDRRLRSFPQLAGVGMRPQLIKLLIRWHTLPVSPGVFAQPFSAGQAWLLLQAGGLRALPEMKEVTFNGRGQIPIARLAAVKVARRVAKLIGEGVSSEAVSVAQALGNDRWTRLERADFTFWSWAREAAKAAGTDEAPLRWKLDAGRVQRKS